MKIFHAPTAVPVHGGLKDVLTNLSTAIRWSGDLSNSINTILSVGNNNTTISAVEEARNNIEEFLSSSNGKYAQINSRSETKKYIEKVNQAIDDYLNTFTLHIDCGNIQGDYHGYDGVIARNVPNAPNAPIHYTDFMKAVHSGDRTDVHIDTNGAYWHDTMPNIYNKYKTKFILKHDPNGENGDALRNLISLLGR